MISGVVSSDMLKGVPGEGVTAVVIDSLER